MADIAVKKLVLQLGRKEVELTIGEAKKLYEALNNLFESKEVIHEYHHHDRYRWDWCYRSPQWTTDTGSFKLEDSKIFCSVSE